MNKKFYICIIVLLIILAICGYFIISKISAQPNPKKMPDFVFLALDGKPFNDAEIPKSKNYLILYFSPDCHYCTDEMNDIIKNITHFKGTYIILVSPSSIQELKTYEKYLSKTQLNIKILPDSKFVFSKYFGPSSIPTTFIYNSKRELVKKIEGGSSAKHIYSNLK